MKDDVLKSVSQTGSGKEVDAANYMKRNFEQAKAM